MKISDFKHKLGIAVILVPLYGCQNNHSFQLSQELGALKPTSAHPEKVYKTCDQKSNMCIEMNTIDGSQLKLHRNTETNTMYAKGEITISDSETGKKIKQSVDLEGVINSEGKIHLQPVNENDSEYKVKAAVTCKDKNENGTFNCEDLLVDLVAKKDKNFFSTQLETILLKSAVTVPTIQTNPSVAPTTSPSPIPKKISEPEPSISDSELIGDGDDSGLPDRYVGASFEELKRLLDSTHLPPKDAPKEVPVKDKKADTPKSGAPESPEVKKSETHKKENAPETSQGVDKKTAPCKNSFLCDEAGNVLRPIDQAYGSPERSNGHLTNASDLLDFQNFKSEKVHFEIRKPQENRYFLTYELMMIIHNTSEYIQNLIPNFILGISDCSKKNGGHLPPHMSHRNGLDVDMPYIIKNADKVTAPMKKVVANNKLISDFDLESQWKTFKYLVQTDKVDRIFIHHIIKKNLCQASFVKKDLKSTSDESSLAKETLRRLRERASDHADHFHLRVKCSAYDRRCQQSLPPADNIGC